MALKLNYSHSTHQTVASLLNEQWKMECGNDHPHLSTITQAAFLHIEKMDSKENCSEKHLLEHALKHIVISPQTPWTPKIKHESLSKIQGHILNVLRGNLPSTNELLKADYLLAVVWKKNPDILREARQLIDHIFLDMMEQLNQKELTESEAFHMEMLIGDLLSLYPFLGPEQGEQLFVPIQIEQKWQFVEYTVDRLPFTPDWMGSPLVAFGLTPKNNSAPPLLLFKGTTYPTDDGFGLSLLTDINPFASVGKYGFKLGEKIISSWLKEHTAYAKAKLYGKSLGGALAWQTALGYPEYIEKTMTYGAPGFCSADLKRCRQLEEQQMFPSIDMFYQENDPVAIVDKIANSGIQYYMVLGKHCRQGIAAHADIYSTHEMSSIIRLNPHEKTKRWARFAITLCRIIASISIFPFLISLYGAKIAFMQIKEVVKYSSFIFSNHIAIDNKIKMMTKF